MSPVRRSNWPLFALLAAFAALASQQARAQNAVLPSVELRSQTDGADNGDLPDLGATPDDQDATQKPKLKKPKRKPTDLPPLQSYKGSRQLGLRGSADAASSTTPMPPPSPSPTDAAPAPIEPIPPGPTVAVPERAPPLRKIPVDDAPFDPVGIRLGDIDVKPYLEQDVGYASNPLGAATSAKASAFETTEAGVSWQSVWLRDDFHGELKAGYTDYFATPTASGPYGSGVVDGRVDVSKDLAIDSEGRFNVATQSLASFGVPTAPGATSPYIDVVTYGATFGATQKFGDLSVGLHGSLDRQSYQDAALSSLNGLGLSADDYNDYGLLLRVAYRVSEAFSPFVELGYDTRRYDDGEDAQGYLRNSTGATGKAGFTLNFSQLISGEASLGYGERKYEDPRLPAASAPLINASLIWALTPLTTINLKAATLLNDSILAGASADINHTYTVEIDHSLTRALLLGLTATYATDDFVGVSTRDSATTLGAKAEYHLNRDVVLKATATHQVYNSNQPGQNYTDSTVMLGVRVQR